jgi:hypothetical protein
VLDVVEMPADPVCDGSEVHGVCVQHSVPGKL